MYEQSRSYLACHLAGFAHRDGIEVFGELAVGSQLDSSAQIEHISTEREQTFDFSRFTLY